jgi:hypothetical protein
MLDNEIDREKGSGTVRSEDFFRIMFKGKAMLDVTALRESARGGRRHGILAEEMKDLPGDEMNAIALPLLNISRRCGDGQLNPHEPHQQQTYIGSAGYVGSNWPLYFLSCYSRGGVMISFC